MPTVEVPAELSPEILLRAAAQFSAQELDQFVAQVIALRGQRQGASLPRAEAELLMRINQGLPPERQQRFDELLRKRDAEQLSGEEHQELLSLTDEVEQLDARRVELLTELARLRGTTLVQLMHALKIPSAHE